MPATLGIRSPDINGAAPTGPIDPNNDLVHYFHVAALVIIVYDHFLTLDSEVEYIWSKRWSKSKVLFILARYFGDLLLISVCVVFLNRHASYLTFIMTCLIFSRPASCKNFLHVASESHQKFTITVFSFTAVPPSGDIGLKFVGTGSMVIIIITQMIMQLRIKALYGKVVSVLVTLFWVMEVVAVLGLGIASLVAIDVHPVLLEAARTCNPTYLPRFAFLFWVPVIAFESFLFSLALGIAYRNYLEIGNWRGASLLYIVLRDNFFFFVCAFALYIVTATTWIAANPIYFTVPGSFSCSLTSIMGCRLIINLCEAYHHPRDSGETGSPPMSIWAVTTKNIQFISVQPTSKSVASGLPRWRYARSQRRELVVTDFPSQRLATMPCISYDITGTRIAARSEVGETDVYEMHTVANAAVKIKQRGEDDEMIQESGS